MRYLFSSTKIELDFDVPPHTAVSKLSDKVARSPLSLVAGEGMIGKVTERRVRIWKFSGDRKNHMNLLLRGQFINRHDGRSRFVGQFKARLFIRIFLSFIILIGSLLTLVGIIATADGAPDAWPLIAAGPFMFIFVCIAIQLSKYQMKGDEEWLVANIVSAIKAS